MIAEETIQKPKIEEVSMDALKRDYKLYPRSSVDYLTVGRFMDAMKAGAKFPPMRVCAKTGRIIDGFHRYTAYSEMRVQMVTVICEEVADDADFFMRAVEANKTHGLGYSGADHEKIAKVAKLLKLDRVKVSFAMAIPVQKFYDLQRATPQAEGEPIKVGTQFQEQKRNYIDKPDQSQKVDRTSVPTGYLFFFNQVIKFLQSDDCDIKNQEVLYKLRETQEVLSRRLNPEGKSLTPMALPEPVKDYYVKWAEREKLPMVNHVVETLIYAAEMDIDDQKADGEMTEAEHKAWFKKFKPHTVMYRIAKD